MSRKKIISLIIAIVILGVLNSMAIISISLIFSDGKTALGITMVILVVLIDLVVLNPKYYAFRYMIPAMILLLILTFYPMYYTFEVAFSNYGTGHLFTRQQTVQKLLTEYFFVPENSQEFDFYIYDNYTDYKPSDNFIILLKRKSDEKLFLANKPEAMAWDSEGDISLAKGVMAPLEKDKATLKDQTFITDYDSESGNIVSFESNNKNYIYFYSPQDQSTKANAPFFYSEIRGKWLKNVEYTGDNYKLRLNANTLFTTFITSDNLYGLINEIAEEGGRVVQKNKIYNKKTDYILPEEEGYFIDKDENGQNFKVAGYIDYVGFKNFIQMFTDPKITGPFFQIFIWTFIWAGLSVLFTFAIGLALALVLNDRNMKGKKIYRTLLIIPWAVPAFISALVWRYGLFNETYGVINRFIIQGIFGGEPIKWLGDAFWAKIAVLIMNTWLGFPYMMTVSLGALQSIPSDLYEAASIDGAKPRQRFQKITFPLLLVTLAPLLVGSFAFNFNNFVGIYLLTQGGPAIAGSSTVAGSTDILISYTYKLAFEGRGQDFGFASAISILIFLIVVGISYFNFKLSGSFEEVNR
ncbi:MAG: maltose/maltodextrin transport system permease protein [Kosmotogales bacterium]|nr:maltose/maltodextrin transport system permease protein [Kosmotogales bacterium]